MTYLDSFSSYFYATWKRRYFWSSLARLDIKMRYQDSILGMLWSLLHPLATTAILCFVFTSLFNVDIRTYIPFLLAGLATWSFISGACLEGCSSVRMSASYMRVYPTPVAVFALRTLGSQLFHFSILVCVSIMMSLILLGTGNLLSLLWLVPGLLTLVVFSFACILAFSLIDVYVPDNKHLLQIALQLVFYTLPIMYPPGAVRSPIFGQVLAYNPLGSFVMLIRTPIVDRAAPPLLSWIIAAVTTSATLALAVFLVRRLERGAIFKL
ncbi:MAG: ABC transporter permease [Gemmataceae bacterium]